MGLPEKVALSVFSESCNRKPDRRKQEKESDDNQSEYEFPDESEPACIRNSRNRKYCHKDAGTWSYHVGEPVTELECKHCCLTGDSDQI